MDIEGGVEEDTMVLVDMVEEGANMDDVEDSIKKLPHLLQRISYKSQLYRQIQNQLEVLNYMLSYIPLLGRFPYYIGKDNEQEKCKFIEDNIE